MKFQGIDDEDELRINMDPRIDCVFQLILFFLVTTAFIRLEQDLSINLPVQSRELKVKPPPARPVVVNVRYAIDEKGRPSFYYHIENERISLPALTINLSRAKVRNKDQAVIIRGDRNVKWEHIAAVMSRCAQAGLSKVSATVEVRE